MTDEERYMKLLDKIQDNTDALRAMLANHETRITVLESKKDNGSDWKNQLLMLLARAIVIGAVAIGSLVGAGSLLQKVIGQ